ncbi:MAG TPA: histidine phosphotransferase family protein [Stellaceae bacterium]|nr:histidine phosphotransferase family protein [Stellaceae bacterium]
MIELRVLELLCARFCHEMVSPVGAINNGVELLSEDDPDFVRDAIGLIGQSARSASKRLQFYRFAYGTTPTAANATPKELLLGLLEGGKVTADWSESLSLLPPEWLRVACNLAVVAVETLPRGGKILLRPAAGAAPGVSIESLGDTLLINPDIVAALGGAVPAADLTSRTIQAHVTATFAHELGGSTRLAETGAARALFVAALR